jgi:hypothetical protein
MRLIQRSLYDEVIVEFSTFSFFLSRPESHALRRRKRTRILSRLRVLLILRSNTRCVRWFAVYTLSM